MKIKNTKNRYELRAICIEAIDGRLVQLLQEETTLDLDALTSLFTEIVRPYKKSLLKSDLDFINSGMKDYASMLSQYGQFYFGKKDE